MVRCWAVLQVWAWVAASAWAQSDADRILLGNDRIRAVFSRSQKGCLVSLVDRRAEREMLAAGGRARLFTLAISEEGTGPLAYVSNTDAREADLSFRDTGETQSVEGVFRDLGGKGVDCTIKVSARRGDPCLRWRVSEVRLPESLVLEQVQFPIFVLRAPPGEGPDAAVIGHTKGGVYPSPSAWKTGESISAGQPGSMAAQFGCYYDAVGGLYWAAEDSRGYTKATWVRRTAGGLEVGWSQSCFARGVFAMDYDLVTTTFASSTPGVPTDWRDAADIYRAWAEKQPWCAKRFAERDDVPGWLKSGPAMVRFTRDWLAQPDLIERWLKVYWLRHFRPHTPLIVAYWGWEKVATWVTPDYFPVYPSDEDFRRVARMNRDLGGHVFLWPSGYHYTITYGARADGSFQWDDRDRFAREAEPHAVVNRDGSVWRWKASWLDGGEMACMCPGDPWTVDGLNRIAEQLVERGAEIIQIDQVVGGRFPPCYSMKHGHPPGPGLWMAEVFRKQLQTMLARCRRTNPAAVVCFEEPNEHFIQQVALQDYRDLETPWSGLKPHRASVFNYLYHEYLPTFQSNPRGGDLRSQAYCLVNGEIPHLVPSRFVGPGPLLDNGGFEEWNGDVPQGWGKVGGYQGEVWSGPCARDDVEKHGGQFSLRLGNLAEGEVVQVSRNLPVGGEFTVGGRYRFSAWLKTRGVTRPNQVMLGLFTADMKPTGSVAGLPMPAEEQGWTRQETTFTVAPGSVLLRIMLHLVGPGTAWVDDVKLERIRDDGTAVEVMRPEVPGDHEFMRRWVDLFAGEGRPYLLHGRMLHPPKLEISGQADVGDGLPAVLHNAFRAPDGSEAVVIVNATDAPRTAALTWHGRSHSLTLRPWEIRLVR